MRIPSPTFGIDNNASWLERAADCNEVRENVARLIHLSSFDLRPPPRPQPVERLSCLCFQWAAYIDAICKDT